MNDGARGGAELLDLLARVRPVLGRFVFDTSAAMDIQVADLCLEIDAALQRSASATVELPAQIDQG